VDAAAPYRVLVQGATLATVLQPRYRALSALMLLVALACVGAGTWQIVRFDDKVVANDDLRANAHASAVPVSQLLPLVGARTQVSEKRVRYRTVTAIGRFEVAQQRLVRNRSVNDVNGWLVLTPLRTSRADLLVVRGFVADVSRRVPVIAAPPSGTVTVRARLQLAEARDDGAAQLSGGQVESINPGNEQRRLHRAVYDGYAELLAHQPGSTSLTPVPAPDLSNPAGGALEPQHFAYIIQWYLFAILALAAPFAMARADRREQVPGEARETNAAAPAQQRAAKLADRYGRAAR
jgi:cytochrome oxidase assembly protein ShyY1